MEKIADKQPFATALVIGVFFGVALGYVNEAMPMWLGIGTLVGAGYGFIMSRRVHRMRMAQANQRLEKE